MNQDIKNNEKNKNKRENITNSLLDDIEQIIDNYSREVETSSDNKREKEKIKMHSD